MKRISINNISDFSKIRGLKNKGYNLLSISRLGDELDTIQYSFLNYNNPSMIKHFIVSGVTNKLESIEQSYPNAKIFEFEVNQAGNQIIQNDEISRNWSINPQIRNSNFNFKFLISNGIIDNVKLEAGFSYRKIENNLKNRDLNEIPNILAKICGLCSTGHTLTYCMLIEDMMGITEDISEQSNLLRMMFCEIERIQNHLLWICLTSFSLELKSISTRILKIRNKLEKEFSKLKITPSLNVIGGVKTNLSDLKGLSASLQEVKELLSEIQAFIEFEELERYISGIAPESKETLFENTAVGPIARSNNINFDIRHNLPYSGYRIKKYNPTTHTGGDTMAIMRVKLDEMEKSHDISIDILNSISDKNDQAVLGEIPQFSELTHSYVEAPSGLLQYTGKLQQGKLTHFHINVPTINNFVTVISKLSGAEIKHIPIILRGIDMGYDPNDQIIFTDTKSEKSKTISGFNLQNKAKDAIKIGYSINFSDL